MLYKSKYPRSYIVLTDKGTKVRRNRKHLLKTNESYHLPYDDYEIEQYNDLHEQIQDEAPQINENEQVVIGHDDVVIANEQVVIRNEH